MLTHFRLHGLGERPHGPPFPEYLERHALTDVALRVRVFQQALGCPTEHVDEARGHGPPGRVHLEATALTVQVADRGNRVTADRHVRDDGRIDFDGLAADPAPLEHYVAYLAAEAPAPDDVAFHVNAYNALAMYNVINTDERPKDNIGFFVLQSYFVDGAYRNLYDYEKKVILPLGEPRVHFALNCMVRSCPRLLRVPYRTETLEVQLEAATIEFLRDDRNVQVDHERREVRLSKVFDWYRADFGGRHAALIAYVNRYRAAPIPPDYRVRFLPWDWTLNSSGPPTEP